MTLDQTNRNVPPLPAAYDAFQLLDPTVLQGHWQRDWRIGRELVQKGHVLLKKDALYLKARRSSVPRAVLRSAFRVMLWVLGLATALALLLTGIGLSWRTQRWGWLLVLPTGGAVWLVVVNGFLSWIAGRILEPSVAWRVAWDDVERVASDGRTLELVFRTKIGRVVGHLVPKKPDARAKGALEAIRDGKVPHAAVSTRRLRNRWVDRGITAAAVTFVGASAVLVEPHVSSRLMRSGLPSSGPLAGIPDALTRAQVEARSSGCVVAPTDAPAPSNQRYGQDLAWTIGAAPGWQAVLLRWEVATSRLAWVDAGAVGETNGRIADFFAFPVPVIGITAAVRSSDLPAFRALIAQGNVETLAAAICAGVAPRFDVTVHSGPSIAQDLVVVRDDDDLIVRPVGLWAEGWILPVRHRSGAGPDAIDLCEVPQLAGQLGLVPATNIALRLSGFFIDDSDTADVYLLDADARLLAEQLGREGTIQRCMVPMSLGFSTSAVLNRSSEVVSAAATWRERAAHIASSAALFTPGARASDIERTLGVRYEAVQQRLGSTAPAEHHSALADGFLDAIPWGVVLDELSMVGSIGRIQRLRKELNASDAAGQAGDRFVMRLTEEFLNRNPPDSGSFLRRIRVGEAWLDVQAGTSWTVDGRDVVADANAANLSRVIGRFLLMDAARHLEVSLNRSIVPPRQRADAFLAQIVLLQHGIAIDIAKSSTQKALFAWVTGDFEYLLDRLLKETAEKLHDQDVALARLQAARLELRTLWTDHQTIRMSSLLMNGAETGWIAQFDAAKTQIGFDLHPNGGADRASLGNPILATSGSYMNDDLQTTGLAVVSGEVKNYLITPKMDGLVVMWNDERGAHVEMLDMKRGGTLPGLGRAVRPLRSLRDFMALTDWMDEHDASAFQTHLLLSGGELLLDPGRASPEQRERRLLVRAAYRDNPIIVIVDLPSALGGYTLHEAMVLAKSALEAPDPGLDVVAIANLDVGSYDVIEAWSPEGGSLRSGRVSLSVARNLITIRP
jgi:hypothetical protein